MMGGEGATKARNAKFGGIGRLFSTCADRKGKCVCETRGGKENRIGTRGDRGRRDERVIYDRSFDILRI